MGKYYSSSSCHWQHRKIKHTLLIWTQVHSCYDTAWVSPTVADESNSPNCIWALKCLKQQAPPTLSRQLQTSSWNYTPNETQNIQTFGNEMSKLLIQSWTTSSASFSRASPQCLIIKDFNQLLIHPSEWVLQCTSLAVYLPKKAQELTSWISADPTSVPFIRDTHTSGENYILHPPKTAPQTSRNLYHIQEQKLL